VQSKKKESCELYSIPMSFRAILTPYSIALQLEKRGASFSGICMVWGYLLFVIIEHNHEKLLNVVEIQILEPIGSQWIIFRFRGCCLC
jgi:hypothetical protein